MNDYSHPGRENAIVVVLGLLIGGGIFFFLLALTGWFLIAALIALPLLAVLGSLHYLLWGRALSELVEEEEVRRGMAQREEPMIFSPPAGGMSGWWSNEPNVAKRG